MIAFNNFHQIDLNLQQHEVLSISNSNSDVSIACEQGVVWITSTADRNDHTLTAGECYVARDSNSVVIEAMQDAVLSLKETDEEELVTVGG